MDELEEKIDEILSNNAENVSANHWINAIHEDKFSKVTKELVELFSTHVVSNNEVAVCDIAMCEKSAGASIFYDPCKDCADNTHRN